MFYLNISILESNGSKIEVKHMLGHYFAVSPPWDSCAGEQLASDVQRFRMSSVSAPGMEDH